MESYSSLKDIQDRVRGEAPVIGNGPIET